VIVFASLLLYKYKFSNKNKQSNSNEHIPEIYADWENVQTKNQNQTSVNLEELEDGKFIQK
jgi:hypothetical protein